MAQNGQPKVYLFFYLVLNLIQQILQHATQISFTCFVSLLDTDRKSRITLDGCCNTSKMTQKDT